MTHQELIENPDYALISSLNHLEIKGLVLNEIAINQGWAKIANMYQVTGILAFIIGTFKAFMPFFVTREMKYIGWLGIGVIFAFSGLIILHELIHAAAYRWVGAKHLSFGMILRKFIFYVQADKQVLNYQQFKIVALAPTIGVILLSITGMAVFYNQPLFYFFLPIFSFHSIFSAGDFGLLCFFQNRNEQEILTFDVKDEGRTYFYGKRV